MNICLIPARGGSKRIPRKNIKIFHNKPMIAWSIQAAHESQCFDRIVVSTDDIEIAKIAREYGAETPFLRPNQFSDDHATTQDVILHALREFNELNWTCTYLCCLYATAPFVQPSDINAAFKRLKLTSNDSLVFTATTYPFPIQRAFHIDDKGYSHMFNPDCFATRSQDLREAYHDAGQFYIASPQLWNTAENLFEGSLPLILPRWRVQDIDTPEDWQRAQFMHQTLHELNMLEDGTL